MRAGTHGAVGVGGRGAAPAALAALVLLRMALAFPAVALAAFVFAFSRKDERGGDDTNCTSYGDPEGWQVRGQGGGSPTMCCWT